PSPGGRETGHIYPSYLKSNQSTTSAVDRGSLVYSILEGEKPQVKVEEYFCPFRKNFRVHKIDGRGLWKKLPAGLPAPEIQQLPFPKPAWSGRFSPPKGYLSGTRQGMRE